VCVEAAFVPTVQRCCGWRLDYTCWNFLLYGMVFGFCYEFDTEAELVCYGVNVFMKIIFIW